MTKLNTLRKYQKRINKAVDLFLRDITKIRGQVYSPTGSGKTECFNHTIHDLSTILGKLDTDLQIAVVHPRIALSQEQLGRMKQAFGTRFHYTSLHSGAHINGEEIIQEKSTLDPEELFRIMNAVPNSHITFTSYDSFDKIKDVEFDLMICDEAHNLTQNQYKDTLTELKAKKILFYTATPINKALAEDANGMNNLHLFGEPIVSVQPLELIKQGYIVPPLMHFLRVSTNKKGTEVDSTEIVANAYKQQHEQMMQYKMPYVQMLVASRGLEDHKNVESELVKLWELIGEQVPVYVVEGGDHRKNGRKFPGTRYDMLKEIKNSKGNAIIMHYDTLAEGIDISSLTGACILRNMSKAKLLQTIGRCGRPFVSDLDMSGEVICMKSRMKPICIITLPVIDGTHIGGLDAKQICEAFIDGGYDDLSTYMTDADKHTMAERDNNFDLGEAETDQEMAHIQDATTSIDGDKLLALGFMF
jgi:hypothetical protein